MKDEEILNQGPIRKKGDKNSPGYQIDFLIQTRTKSIYVCEVKLSSSSIGSEVTIEIKDKIKKLNAPRGFAVIPVLITNAEVTKGLVESNYFGRIVTVNKFLD